MIVELNEGKKFALAPEGMHQAVCVDVIDKGMVEATFEGQKKMQHKVSLIWEIDKCMEDGRRFTVQRRFTVSLHEKSGLHKVLKTWLGQGFLNGAKSLDLETLIGKSAMIVTQHEEHDGETYSNIVSITKCPVAVAPSGSYVRAKDREKVEAPY